MLLTWAPKVLRAAGLTVSETSGWTGRSHGEFPNSISGVWHHDASPPGDSPGVLGWMVSNWNSASANFWVDRAGVWHCVGAGIAWHAGTTLPGMPGNSTAFGVEWDQTVNETPAPAGLQSVQRGMAALLAYMSRDGSSLHFHKTIASPPGRKVDPWLSTRSNNQANWSAELAEQRAIVNGYISGGGTPTPQPPDAEDDDDMGVLVTADGRGYGALIGARIVGLGSMDSVNALRAAGWKDAKLATNDFDRLAAMLPPMVQSVDGRIGVFAGGIATWLGDPATVAAFRNLGAETVVTIADADFTALSVR